MPARAANPHTPRSSATCQAQAVAEHLIAQLIALETRAALTFALLPKGQWRGGLSRAGVMRAMCGHPENR